MASMLQQRVSVTLPRDVSAFLHRRARRDQMPLAKTILAIVVDSMATKDDGEAWELPTPTPLGKFRAKAEDWRELANA